MIDFNLVDHLRNFLRDQSGATAIEYAMIASGVACAIAAVVFTVGTRVNQMFTTVDSALK
ncbi:MAG TPA: Flp family type IVb pilin [Pseudolabrys sp.]|nr:Flp family type IVb pilin [Pseudolabrys sp.]